VTPPFPSVPATDRDRHGLTWLSALAERALDLVLPPRCVACEEKVLRQGMLCGACFGTMTFITAPFCDQCGLPFASDQQADPRCVSCSANPPGFRKSRAGFVYDDGVRRLLLPFKHGDRPTLARALAPHLARAGADLLADQPLLVPVPLHRLRLLRRRYNQAALLAQAVGRIMGCKVVPDMLRRVRATVPLDDRSPDERRAILAGAIAVRQRRRPVLVGRRVVLIDDVMTSGATANACAAALIDAGAVAVDVLVAARVPLARNGSRSIDDTALRGVAEAV